MTAFRFRALDAQGQAVDGVLEADTGRAARNSLRERGLLPVHVSSITARSDVRPTASRLKESELVLISHQWATLLSSGLTVVQALSALTEQADREPTRQLLAGIRSEILAGHSLRAALDRYPAAFPAIYRATVAAGEKSGELATVMNHLSSYLERRNSLRQKTLQALLYPAIVATVALLIVIGLMTYVVPQVVTVFQNSNQVLPLLTRVMIGLSSFLRDWGWLLLILVGSSGLAFIALLRDPLIQRRWDQLLMRTPIIGRHLRTLETTRFASTMSILVGSGVPLIAALDAGREVISRIPLRDAVFVATERVREGQSLARAMEATRSFPPLLIHMIANGEATGKLDELLARAAQLSQQELENRTATLTTVIEPLLLLLMGGLVLIIVLAVMQPIIEINTLLR